MDSEDKTIISDKRVDEPIISLKPGTELEEFTIKEKLGQGGFGIVYLAYDKHFDVDRVIKEYFPTQLAYRDSTLTIQPIKEVNEEENIFRLGLDRVIEEARVLAKFEHRNIVKVHRYFEKNGTAYIVMQYVSGPSLKSRLLQEETLAEPVLRPVIEAVMSGLAKVHAEDILHRDIKPDNIILREDTDEPVLIDFGAARQNISQRATAATGYFSAGYTPIEQVTTSGKMGPWTDIYALSATMYHALVGKKPVPCVDRIANDPLIPATLTAKDKASEAFLAAIDWGLSLHAENRPQSIDEWKQAFSDLDKTRIYLKNKTAQSEATEILSPQPKNAQRDTFTGSPEKKRSTGWVVAGSAIVILAAFTFAYLNGFFISKQPSTKIVEVAETAQAVLNNPVPDVEHATLTNSENSYVADETGNDTSVEEIASVTTTVIDEVASEDFAKAQYIDTPEAYQLFLRLHPNSRYRDQAETELAE